MSPRPARTAKGACSSRTKRLNLLPRWWARGHACWTVAPRPAARPQPSPRAILQPRLSPSNFILIAPICCERRVHAANVQVITADILQLTHAWRFRSRTGRCSLFRHWHAGSQSGDQVAAQAARPAATCTPSKCRFCEPRCDNSRPADGLSIPLARWSRKRIKLWWKKSCRQSEISRWSIVG